MINLAIALLSICIWKPPVDFNIPAGRAEVTIATWSRQAHIQVMFRWEVVYGIQSGAVVGKLDPLEALQQMLRATGLRAEYANPRSVAVFEDKHYCRPEFGPDAPLPPCSQRSMVIRAP